MQCILKICMIYLAFLGSIVSCRITVSVEVTHEEHFEVAGIDDQDFIQVFDQKLQEELLHDDDILKFKSLNVEENIKLKHPVNATPPNGIKYMNLSENHAPDLNVTSGSIATHELPNTKDIDIRNSEPTDNDADILDKINSSSSTRNATSNNATDDGWTSRRLTEISSKFISLNESNAGDLVKNISNSSQDNVQNGKMKKIIGVNFTDGNIFQSNLTMLSRNRRSVDFSVDEINNQGWKVNYTKKEEKTPFDDDSFQVISADDKIKAEAQRAKMMFIYVGTTFLSVVGFSALAFCFIRDPMAFIIAFATGCPCCLLIIPCITSRVRKFQENAEKMMRENVNKYMPGIIIHEDGTIEHYQTTPEEIEAVLDIIDEIGGEM